MFLTGLFCASGGGHQLTKEWKRAHHKTMEQRRDICISLYLSFSGALLWRFPYYLR